MRSIALFNHKGGVGKTTLTINIADAMADLGYKILIVDADPQCNLTSFYLSEKELDQLLGESGDEQGSTLWSSIKPVVMGEGPIRDIKVYSIGDEEKLFLCPGDVLLADYEEELPAAWTGSFARKQRDYNVVCALSNSVRSLAKKHKVDIVIYDVGPNVGPLNRTVLMDCDYFATPVGADLFSLRALTTVGRSITRWVTDWRTVRDLAGDDANKLLNGFPRYLGYITSAYKVSSGTQTTEPHEYWEKRIGSRVQARVVQELRKISTRLVPISNNKIGSVKNFQSLAPQGQRYALPIGKLKGFVNAGYNTQVTEARESFRALARELLKRMDV